MVVCVYPLLPTSVVEILLEYMVTSKLSVVLRSGRGDSLAL